MALTYLGSLSLGDVIPGLGVCLASALPRIQAQLAAAIAASAQLTITPPTIAANISLCANLLAQLQAQAALGIQVPSATLQLNALATLIAALNIELGALAFDLSAPGIHAYAYAGESQGLKNELPASFPGSAPISACNALVLATTVGATWAALGLALKTG